MILCPPPVRLGLCCSLLLAAACGDGAAPAVDVGYSLLDASPPADGSPMDRAPGQDQSTPNRPPILTLPGPATVDEEKLLDLTLKVSDPDGDTVRVFVEGLPPGARWDEAKRRLTFRPDFIQGSSSWSVSVTASDGQASAKATLKITARDVIKPPWPTITKTETLSDHTLLVLSQKTDAYLDSPGHAGRAFEARVVIPKGSSASKQMAVRVYLHGFGGTPYTGGSAGQFRIYPHDPKNTYWWGYSERLPANGPSSGLVPNYTQRRVLHLVEWMLRKYPGANPDRVYLVGGSMGGAGAKTLGLLHARHFYYVYATIGQAIPRNHRAARIAQLAKLWGTPATNLPALSGGPGVWDLMDLTRALRDDPAARDQYLFTKHGKDDPTIHFGAMLLKSPLTQLSFYGATQKQRVAHYAVWDEGGHGSADPVMGSSWWDSGWNPVFNSTTYLRRDLAFPAFSNSSADQSPGSGKGNGKQKWDESKGYAGTVSVAGDTGWDGAIAGARNRFLRWDSNKIVDRVDRFEVPLRVLQGTGSAAPKAGYPSKGDLFDRTLPVTVDVTLRRVQRFRCLPGESLSWSFGAQSGTLKADAGRGVTVAGLKLTGTWTGLKVSRK